MHGQQNTKLYNHDICSYIRLLCFEDRTTMTEIRTDVNISRCNRRTFRNVHQMRRHLLNHVHEIARCLFTCAGFHVTEKSLLVS
jgi:hypothetical protein